MRHLLIAMIRLYQLVCVPFLRALCGPGGCCRFEPSCSHYAIGALREHGTLRGVRLAAWRILRCQPWGGSGYDPVPLRMGARTISNKGPIGARHEDRSQTPTLYHMKNDVVSTRGVKD